MIATRHDPFRSVSSPTIEYKVVPDAPAPPAPAPSPNAGGGVKKVSFGKIAKAKDDNKSKTDYPVFPDANGEAAIIAARIKQRTDQFEALEAALETDKAELKMLVSPHYFSVNHGRAEVPSSVSVMSPEGEVLVNYQNRYSMLPDDGPIVAILGDRTEKYFFQSFDFKIKGDKLPTDPEKQTKFFEALQNLFDQHGLLDAIEVKDGIKPRKEFHTARHRDFTVAENLALNQVCPIIAGVKTKGRGGK